MKTKYFAFSGTHGTGKSTQAYTLASHLKLRGKTVILLDELARECPFTINKEASIDTQLWILCAQVKRELELKGKYEYVICDRSVIDTLAYTYAVGLHIDVGCWVDYTSYNYHEVFFIDHKAFNFQIADGVRDLDPEFRENVSEYILDLYEEYNIPYHNIKEASEIQTIIRRWIL